MTVDVIVYAFAAGAVLGFLQRIVAASIPRKGGE